MSDTTLILILVGVLIIAVITLAAALLIVMQRKNKSALKVKIKSTHDFLYTSYLYFSKFFLTRRYIGRIRKRVEILELSDNWTVGRKTMRFAYISLSSAFGMFLFFMFLGLDLYFLIIALLTVYIVHNQILKIFVDGIENKILFQFEKFLGDVRHHFHEHGMIDEAIYDSTEHSAYEISLHANRIYEVLTANDVDEEVEKYNDIAPNKFFKTFLALCHTVQKFGDKVVDGKSMFLSNLNYLKQEINVEMLKRERLSYLFRSLAIIAIAPIFTLKPLEHWAVNNLPELGKYYNGAYGFVVPIVLFALVIIAYQLINKMQSNTDDDESLMLNIEDRLLRVRAIDNIVERLVEKNYAKSLKYSDMLKNTGSRANVRQFYLRRIYYAAVGFILCFMIFFNMHNISAMNILNSNEIIKPVDETEIKAVEEIKKLDKSYMLKYKGKKVTYHEIEQELLDTNVIKDRQLVGTSAKRIVNKINSYNNQYFKWWELIICFVLAVMFYNVPYFLVIFKKKVLQMGMEDEVMQFHSIILMLMHIERITVENILQWMELFAVIFKGSISKCMDNFEHGDYEALEQLKIDEPFLPFTRLVENLQAASDKIPIEQAFDELIIERGYYQEKRKLDNEMMINKKALWGRMIAFAPLVATLFLQLLLPFSMESINQLFSYSDQIKNVM
ncbi:MAG: hypothetical protein N3B21_00315 [Clostridia bacterium]|nr:hypothetical protein [Clostridia bacterium]